MAQVILTNRARQARRMRLAALLLGAAVLPQALAAQDLPTGGLVRAGDVVIGPGGPGPLVVTQTGSHGIIDWTSFGIGAGQEVSFANGTGATLNRVTGGLPSAIMGRLSATGSVYLVNPDGVVVGPSGVVQTDGRFVASTLDVAAADFLDGGDLTFGGDSAAMVVNFGSVGSLGGDVALIARQVANEGSLSAPQGTVGLVAGSQVLMRDAAVDEGMFSVLVGGGDVVEAGEIRAAAAELRAKGGNVYALAGNTQGVIAAEGVEKVEGRIFLTAPGGKVSVDKAVTAGDADGSGGHIEVTGQTIDLAGSLEASGLEGGFVKVKAVGDTSFTGSIQALGGGFVEVSGRHVTLEGKIRTGGGSVLIDPENIEIGEFNSSLLSDATLVEASFLESLLSDGSVTLDTSSPGPVAGTIVVVSDVTWSSGSSLTLLAQGDIWVMADVMTSGAGSINLVAGWDGTTSFDAATYDAVALGSGLFGTANGTAYSFDGQNFTASGDIRVGIGFFSPAVAVGSKAGATRLYANTTHVTAGSAAAAGAQIGYRVEGGSDYGDITGDIRLRNAGSIWIQPDGANSYAMIGHVGRDYSLPIASSTVDVNADIIIEATGGLTIWGGAAQGAFGMVGHGGGDNFGDRVMGDRSGNIDITLGGNLTIGDSEGAFADPYVGHQTTGTGVISLADITVTAGGFDLAALSGAINVRMWADASISHDVRLIQTAGDVTLTGTTENINDEDLSVSADGDLIIQTAGTLTLAETFQFGNSGTGSLVLSGASIVNEAGSDALLTVGGGWRIYSTRPDQDSGTLGALAAGRIVYGEAYDPDAPMGSVTGTANALYYTVIPEVRTDLAELTYGDEDPAVSSQLYVGSDTVDALSFGFELGLANIDPDAVTRTGAGFLAAGTYEDALFADITFAGASSITGFTETLGDIIVDQAVLSLIINDETRTYDGSQGGTFYGFDGFVGGDDDSVIVSGPVFAYDGGDDSGINAGTYTVTGSGLVDSGGNYTFDYTDTGLLTINPRALSVVFARDVSKQYDGTSVATLTADDFEIFGLVSGEGATITQTQGTFLSSQAGLTSVQAGISSDDIAFDTGTLAVNYLWNEFVSGSGQIDPRDLVVTIVGNPTRRANGTTLVTLGPSNLQISGLVSGEDISLGQIQGNFHSAAPGVQSVMATLDIEDYQVDEGVDLANYNLPSTAAGTGTILGVQRNAAPETPVVAVSQTAEPPADPEPPSLNGALEVIATETTAQIVEQIEQGSNFCSEFVDPEYAIDCLSDRLQSVADGLSATGEYSEIRAALEDAAAELEAIARENASASLTRSVARATDGSGRTSGRPLTPVDGAALASANARAAAIIAETQLVLLRSSAQSERRRVAYQQVGQVLGTTTVLLRS